MTAPNLEYKANHTIAKFHRSSSYIRGLMGPVGSGKSVGCAMEIMKRAFEQRPNHEGIRKTKWVVIRNTYRELEDTTLRTWFDHFPPNKFPGFKQRTMTHRLRFGQGAYQL